MINKKDKQKNCVLALITAGLITLCGCTDISHREFIYVSDTEKAPASQPSDNVGGELLVVTSQTEAAVTTSETEQGSEIPTDSLSEGQREFLDSCLFIGDSVCSGLGVYNIAKNCMAKGGVAARNIEEFTFDSGGVQVSPYTAIVNSGCKNLVFMMGINDVNIETAEDYVNYYDSFLSRIEALTTGTSIYILSITPVTYDSTFCYNYQIEEFNAKLKDMTDNSSKARKYIDVTVALKDINGNLKPEFASDTTVHLKETAYYSIVSEFCRQAGHV